MKVARYTDWNEYKENKLAAKQADKMFNTLVSMTKNNATAEEFQAYYATMWKSHLYNKHGALYCQVLSDVHRVMGD